MLTRPAPPLSTARRRARPLLPTGATARRRRRGWRDDSGEGLEFAIVMIAVFALLISATGLGARWLAAGAADAAANRALEIARSVDGTPADAQAVAATLAGSSGVVSHVDTTVSQTTTTTTVTVTVHTRLRLTVTRTVSGPRERFVPQQAGAR